MTASPSMYVDVAAARIQHYIGRTPRLKGQRGASAWLSWATSAGQVKRVLRDTPALRAYGAELNPEAGQADGLISVRLPEDSASRAAAQVVAGTLAAYLRAVLPSLEISGLWGAGPSYLEAYRDQMKPLRDDPPLVSLPPSAGFPPLESCAEWRADPVAGQIEIHETALGVCLDCLARYQDLYRRPGLAAEPRRLPIYREEADLARALGRDPVAGTAQDFHDLAALGGQETWRNTSRPSTPMATRSARCSTGSRPTATRTSRKRPRPRSRRRQGSPCWRLPERSSARTRASPSR